MFKTAEEIRNAKTADLIAFYNAKAEKPVKKFADRATAEKRCVALLSAIEALEADKSKEAAQVWEDDEVRPVIHTPRAVKVEEEVDTESMSDEEFKAHMFSEVEKKEERASNAAGIAKSWSDPVVAEKRLTRNGVEVEGYGEFKSVRVAFAELKLPDSKHIRFRLKLKEAKVAVFEWAGKSYTFKLV